MDRHVKLIQDEDTGIESVTSATKLMGVSLLRAENADKRAKA